MFLLSLSIALVFVSLPHFFVNLWLYQKFLYKWVFKQHNSFAILWSFPFRVLLTSAPRALYKDSKRINYFLKKSNISIFDALVTHIFIINYYLKVLTSCLVDISLFYIKVWLDISILVLFFHIIKVWLTFPFSLLFHI